MICVCMQPSFMPWLGYFDLYDQADVFVILDDCQYEPRSWQQRNRIVVAGQLQWVTVPVRRAGLSGQLIRDVRLAEDAGKKREKMLKTIKQAYGSAQYYNEIEPVFSAILKKFFIPGAKLLDLGIALFEWMIERLGWGATLHKKPILSSALRAEGRRSAMLVDICRKVDCDTYLTTTGSCGYLREDRAIWEESGIEVLVHNYKHPQYSQGSLKEFVPFASTLDLMMHHDHINYAGDVMLRASDIIVSGRRPATPLFGKD